MTDPVILDLVLEGQVGDRYFSMTTAHYPDHVPVDTRFHAVNNPPPADGPKATLIERATSSDGRQVARYQLPDGWPGTTLFGDWRRDPFTDGMYLAQLVIDFMPAAQRLRACPNYSTDPGSEHIPDDEPDTCAGCGGTPTGGPTEWCAYADASPVLLTSTERSDCALGLSVIADQWGEDDKTTRRRHLAHRLDPIDDEPPAGPSVSDHETVLSLLRAIKAAGGEIDWVGPSLVFYDPDQPATRVSPRIPVTAQQAALFRALDSEPD